MRTTLTLDSTIARELKRRAAETGKPFKAVVNETLLLGLSRPSRSTPYRLRTVSLGGPREGIDLTKALQLAAALEDEETTRKLARRR